MRKKLNKRKAYFVKKVNNFICKKCEKKFSSDDLEIDHIIPVYDGGSDDYNNLQPLCIECHLKKCKGEWSETYRKDNIDNLEPEEKLEMIKEYLEENKSKSYNEISFLILNHPLFSKFNYNSTVLNSWYREISNKYKKDIPKNQKYKEQRDKILFLLRKHTKKTYQELEELCLDLDLDLSYVQIRNICVKFGDSERLDLKKAELKLKRELKESDDLKILGLDEEEENEEENDD